MRTTIFSILFAASMASSALINTPPVADNLSSVILAEVVASGTATLIISGAGVAPTTTSIPRDRAWTAWKGHPGYIATAASLSSAVPGVSCTLQGNFANVPLLPVATGAPASVPYVPFGGIPPRAITVSSAKSTSTLPAGTGMATPFVMCY